MRSAADYESSKSLGLGGCNSLTLCVAPKLRRYAATSLRPKRKADPRGDGLQDEEYVGDRNGALSMPGAIAPFRI